MIDIRMAATEDAGVILDIYRPYVTDTVITFEYEPPTLEEFEERIRRITKAYPFLVALEDGIILGYAYADRFRSRAAYSWSVETSIYVRQDMRCRGIGRKLYECLEMILKKQGILNMNACIAYGKAEDEYMTFDSVRFHEHMGFNMVGTFNKSGYKFGRWYDMVWMEKLIGEHLPDTKPPKKVTELDCSDFCT